MTDESYPKPDPTLLIPTLSNARLTPYRNYFGCKNDTELLGVYLWGQVLAGAMQPCLGMYEVTLRNAVHRAASQFASRGQSDSFPWYDFTQTWALPTKGKTRDKVAQVLYNTSSSPPLRLSTQPSPDAVVAALSFGFWPGFLEGLTMRERPKILTETFVGHPNSKPKHWSDSRNVVELIQTLKKIQDTRNAVAHLEPIWKSHRLKGSEKNWSHSIVSLREVLEEMIRVMAWCCPAAAAALHHSFARRLYRSICSTDAVRAFMSSPLEAGSMQLFASSSPAVASNVSLAT